MTLLLPGMTIVATGTFLYEGTVECDLRILHSPIRYGSGDYEDEAEWADDVDIDTYYLEYGSATQRGVFNAGGRGYPSLAEARSAVEAAAGIGPTVRWHECEDLTPGPRSPASSATTTPR